MLQRQNSKPRQKCVPVRIAKPVHTWTAEHRSKQVRDEEKLYKDSDDDDDPVMSLNKSQALSSGVSTGAGDRSVRVSLGKARSLALIGAVT